MQPLLAQTNHLL